MHASALTHEHARTLTHMHALACVQSRAGPGLASKTNRYAYIDTKFCEKQRLQDWFGRAQVVRSEQNEDPTDRPTE